MESSSLTSYTLAPVNAHTKHSMKWSLVLFTVKELDVDNLDNVEAIA